MFDGRKLVVATKHGKEKVIAPVLEKELGVSCFAAENFDTDAFGTFTGEIERVLNPLETARKKCLTAMERNGCDLGVASEGSFGPHPSFFWVNADDEMLIFIDRKNELEIVVREISSETNFNGKQISSEKELLDFAASADFPSHALILSPSKEHKSDLFKGITDAEKLKNIFHEIFEKNHSAYVETDMRAMFNPSRMKVIEAAARKLAAKIRSRCPECQTPGFGVTEARQGLPCGLCGSPTNSTLAYVYVCQKCQFAKDEIFPHGKTSEDPTYCDYCNP